MTGSTSRSGRGEIHALLGENGAGKSTLVKILYGVVEPSAGEILWEGRPVAITSPVEARRLGIGMVFQHFSLFDELTVAENIAVALSDEWSLGQVRGRIGEVSRAYGLALEPDRAVVDPLGGRAAAHRNRPLPAAKSAAPDSGRADLRPDTSGGGASLRDPRQARRRGLRDPLHLPQARGGAPPVRPRHHPAGRPGRRDHRPARSQRARNRRA